MRHLLALLLLLPLAASLRLPTSGPQLNNAARTAAAATVVGSTALTALPQAAMAVVKVEGASESLLHFPIKILFITLQDYTDLYYLLVGLAALGFFIKNSVVTVVDEAKAYDERGAMANQMMAEAKKRERAEALQRTKENDVAYERLQAEAKQRAEKKSGWRSRMFGDDE